MDISPRLRVSCAEPATGRDNEGTAATSRLPNHTERNQNDEHPTPIHRRPDREGAVGLLRELQPSHRAGIQGHHVALVIWALIWPAEANTTLGNFKGTLLDVFNVFYIVIVGCFIFFLLRHRHRTKVGVAKDGQARRGAGILELLVVLDDVRRRSRRRPDGLRDRRTLGLWASNPVLLADGSIAPNSEEAVQSGYRYTFAHYGFHAWAIYVVTGLSLAYYAYTRDMPLTIRSALTPLFGSMMNGFLGHLVDVLAVVATILGVSVTIGIGVSQFINGLYSVAGWEWIMNMGGDTPSPARSG